MGINLSKETIVDLEKKGPSLWLAFIKRVSKKYSEKISENKKALRKRKSLSLHRKGENLKRRLDDFTRFSEYISMDPDNWIVDYDPYTQRLSFKPIRVDKYAKEVLLNHGEVCLFMSGTILNQYQFAKWLGIDKDEIYAIRRKSPFDVRRNPIKTYRGFDMTYRNLKPSAKRSLSVIREILERHKNEKGIIHTVSYQCKEFLMRELDNPRLVDHKTNDREEVLERFKKSKDPLVLISPSMNEGVDLPEEQCRFQIIYKIPYPNITDKQTKIRRSKERIWYDYQTAINLVQTYGRGMRSENDYCRTYFIDSRIKNYIKRDSVRNNLIPDFFREAVDAEPAEIPDWENIDLKENINLGDSVNQISVDSKEKIDSNNLNNLNQTNLKSSNKSKGKSVKYKKSEINTKYKFMKKGRELARENKKEAISFYKSLLMNKCFENDYYPYRKLVVLYNKTKDSKNELEIIRFFFSRGIHCPRRYYFWFLNKLLKLSKKGLITKDEIRDLERLYMENGFKNKSIQDRSMIIADRIDTDFGRPYVLSEYKFNAKLKSREIIEEGKYYENLKDYEKAIELYSEALFDRNFKSYEFYQRICFSLEELGDYERELEYINSYFENKNVNKTKSSEKWFKKRLEKVNHVLEYKDKDVFEEVSNKKNKPSKNKPSNNKEDNGSDLDLNSLSIDSDNLDLIEYDDSLTLEENTKRKILLKEKFLELRSEKMYFELLSYLKALSKNSYFKNDYYPLRHQCLTFEQLEDYQQMLDSIRDMLLSGVYLTCYQLAWINSKKEIIKGQTDFDDDEFDEWMDYYMNNGAKNESYSNNPVPLADRLIKSDGKYIVISMEDFEFNQKRYEFNEKGRSLEKQARFEEAINLYKKIINEKKYNHYDFYKRICFCLENLDDYEMELDAIKLYYADSPIDADESSDKWFENRLKNVNFKLNTSYVVNDFK